MTTVKDLIEQLSKMPGDLPVCIQEKSGSIKYENMIVEHSFINTSVGDIKAIILKVNERES